MVINLIKDKTANFFGSGRKTEAKTIPAAEKPQTRSNSGEDLAKPRPPQTQVYSQSLDEALNLKDADSRNGTILKYFEKDLLAANEQLQGLRKRVKEKQASNQELAEAFKSYINFYKNLEKRIVSEIEASSTKLTKQRKRDALIASENTSKDIALSALKQIRDTLKSGHIELSPASEKQIAEIAQVAVSGVCSNSILESSSFAFSKIDTAAAKTEKQISEQIKAVQTLQMAVRDKLLVNHVDSQGNYIPDDAQASKVVDTLMAILANTDLEDVQSGHSIEGNAPPEIIAEISKLFRTVESDKKVINERKEQVEQILDEMQLSELGDKIRKDYGFIADKMKILLGNVYTENQEILSVNNGILTVPKNLLELRRQFCKTALHALWEVSNGNFDLATTYEQDLNNPDIATRPLWQKQLYERISKEYQEKYSRKDKASVDEELYENIKNVMNEIREHTKGMFRLHEFAERRRFTSLDIMRKKAVSGTSVKDLGRSLVIWSSIFSNLNPYTAEHVFHSDQADVDKAKIEIEKKYENVKKACEEGLIAICNRRDFNLEKLQNFLAKDPDFNLALPNVREFISNSLAEMSNEDKREKNNIDQNNALPQAAEYAVFLLNLITTYTPVENSDSKQLKSFAETMALYSNPENQRNMKQVLTANNSMELFSKLQTSYRKKSKELAEAVSKKIQELCSKEVSKDTSTDIKDLSEIYFKLEHDAAKEGVKLNDGEKIIQTVYQYQAKTASEVLESIEATDTYQKVSDSLTKFLLEKNKNIDIGINHELVNKFKEISESNLFQKIEQREKAASLDSSLRRNILRILLANTGLEQSKYADFFALLETQICDQPETLSRKDPSSALPDMRLLKNYLVNDGLILVRDSSEERIKALTEFYRDTTVMVKLFGDKIFEKAEFKKIKELMRAKPVIIKSANALAIKNEKAIDELEESISKLSKALNIKQNSKNPEIDKKRIMEYLYDKKDIIDKARLAMNPAEQSFFSEAFGLDNKVIKFSDQELRNAA